MVTPAEEFTAIVSVALEVCGDELWSVTVAVKMLVPVPVGVPEIAPEEESDNPAGRLPEVIDQLYGAVPPVAVNVALYAVPCVALGNEVVVVTEVAEEGASTRIVSP